MKKYLISTILGCAFLASLSAEAFETKAKMLTPDEVIELVGHAVGGANIIVNPSASIEVSGSDSYRKDLVKGQSARLLCGYITANAGEGESTQDVVYSGHNLIAENGNLLRNSAARFFSILPTLRKP